MPTAHVQRLNIQVGAKTTHLVDELYGIPVGSKVVSAEPCENGSGRSAVRFGIYHTHKEFEQRMSRLVHPYDSKGVVEDDTLRAVFELLTEGPREIARRRELAFELFEKLKVDTKRQDDEIRKAMTPGRAHIMKDRAFSVFQELCAATGINDDFLHEKHVIGTEFTGLDKDCEEFASQCKPAPMSTDQVQRAATWTRRRSLDQSVPKVASDLDVAVWTKRLGRRSRKSGYEDQSTRRL